MKWTFNAMCNNSVILITKQYIDVLQSSFSSVFTPNTFLAKHNSLTPTFSFPKLSSRYYGQFFLSPVFTLSLIWTGLIQTPQGFTVFRISEILFLINGQKVVESDFRFRKTLSGLFTKRLGTNTKNNAQCSPLTSLKINFKELRKAMTMNRACVFSNRPYTSHVEKQKFLWLDLWALKLAQKIQVLFYSLYDLGYVVNNSI